MPGLVDKIRERRWAMTDAERLLWSRLRNGQLGVVFECRVPVGPYLVDFLCRERRLVVEVLDPSAVAREEDRERDAFLRAAGFRLRRFPAYEVMLRPEAVMAALWLATEAGAAGEGGQDQVGRARRQPPTAAPASPCP